MLLDLLRNTSQCNRVFYLAIAMSVATLAVGGLAGYELEHAAATGAATLVLAIAVTTALLSTATGWLIRTSIKAPVEDTVQAVIRIAGGDLETKVDSPGRDELSWLRHELNGMRKKLREMVREVQESVQHVGAASEEIARGNHDLSQRTERQADALRETAGSIDRLTEAVRTNAQSAEGARSEAQSTTHVAHRGGELMAELERRMQDIRGSAERIVDIISVIDGIAFQTNILALNAAVEAARAGDHGRGFAVVASEVRSLAQRSASAAREVKALIDNSSETIDAGSRLVGDAGQTVREILERVDQMSKLVVEIAGATGAQSEGIGQVHSAVGEIDSATQQNAALVQQVATVSQSLTDQAARLAKAMGAFKLSA